jgi:UPF0716 protein FxsA
VSNRWFFLLVVGPAIEIASIVLMTQWIGGAVTFLWITVAFVLGALVMRYAGRSWWSGLRQAAGAPDETGVATPPRKPDTARMADQGLLFLAGLLIAIPGFVGDVLGVLLLLPFVRRLFRVAAAAWFMRRFTSVTGPGGVTVWQRRSDATQPVPGTVRVERVYPREIVQGDVVDPGEGPPADGLQRP